jgi:hypothetical protein
MSCMSRRLIALSFRFRTAPRREKLRNSAQHFAPRHRFSIATAYDHLQLTGENARHLQGSCSLELHMPDTVQSAATPLDHQVARKRL